VIALVLYALSCLLAAFIAGMVAALRYSSLTATEERQRLSDAPVIQEIER